MKMMETGSLSSLLLLITVGYFVLFSSCVTSVPMPQHEQQQSDKTLRMAAGDPNADGNVNVYLLRTKRYQDQHVSSSSGGYMYKTQGPTSYVHFKTSYSQNPVAQGEHVPPSLDHLPSITANIGKNIAKKEIDEIDEDYDAGKLSDHSGDSDDLEEYSDEEDDGKENYEVGNGSAYENAENSKRGSKGSNGYANNEQFAKGQSGEHSEGNVKSSHGETAGSKSANHDDAAHYSEGHSQGRSNHGESHGHSESHKKGSKTTGYHKVYRKDEYKKDHQFYDEKDVNGHHDSYGSEHKKHRKGVGEFRNGGHHASKHHEAKNANAGQYDKGRYDDYNSGFKGARGGENYHQNHQDYEGSHGKHSHTEKAY